MLIKVTYARDMHLSTFLYQLQLWSDEEKVAE